MSTPIRRRTFLGAGAAGLVGVLLAACGGKDDDNGAAGGTVPLNGATVPEGRPPVDLTPTQESAGRDVVMIGDSITVGSAPGLEAAAEQLGVRLTIYAEVGRRITIGRDPLPGIDVMEDVLGGGVPDLIVIALGTNDIGKYASQEEYEEQINQLLALIPAATPVAWINTYLSDYPDDSALFNAALIASLEARGNATIAKWSNIASEDDDALEDGIHPSEDGRAQFTDLVGNEISNWLN